MEKELIKVIKILNKHKIKYMLVGGYAAILYGVKRATFDIDIAIALSQDNIRKTTELLHNLSFIQIPPQESGIHPNYGIKFSNGKAELDLMFIENPRFDIKYIYHETLQYKYTVIKNT